jgi:hypothetical protein
MIHGAHVIISSTNPEADRAFFRDVMKYRSADAGHGWLIFALPPAEVAVHPSDANDVHTLYLMCDDIEELVEEMTARGFDCDPVSAQPWGLLTHMVLPGGGKLGVYQPRHASPLSAPKKSKATTTKRKAKPTRTIRTDRAKRKKGKRTRR